MQEEGRWNSWLANCTTTIVLPEKWPQRLPVASEVTSDLEFELSGLNNLCSSASLASFVLYSTKCPEERKKGRKVEFLVGQLYHYHCSS